MNGHLIRPALLRLAILLCGWLPLHGLAQSLRVATEGAYPPLNYVDENGKPTGFDVDIAREICVHLKRECVFVIVPWDQLLAGLQAGKYEMIAASMAKTPERERLADFTDSYYRTHNIFVGRAGASVAPEALRGRTIASQAGTIYAEYLHQHHDGPSRILLTATIEESYAALVSGAADFVLSDTLSTFGFLRSDPGQPFDILGEPVDVDGRGIGAYLQVQKGNDTLREAVNKALREMRLDGTYHKVNARYFPFDIY